MKPDYIILNGLSEKFYGQLIGYSNNTSDSEVILDGDGERFKNFDALDKWLAKGRICYTVTDSVGDDLLGLYWFGKESIPPPGKMTYTQPYSPDMYQHTFALRLYKHLRHAHLGREIFARMVNLYIHGPHYDGTGIWGSTQHAGTIIVGNHVGMNQMTRPQIDTTVYSDPRTNPRVIVGATDAQIRNTLKILSKTNQM